MRVTHQLTGHSKKVAALAFHPDGRQLASVAEDPCTRVWNLDTGEATFVLREGEDFAECTAISPDGRFLIAGADLGVWNLESGAKVRSLQTPGAAPWSVAFSPDGQRIVATGADMMVRVWDTSTGLELLSLPGHVSRGRSVTLGVQGQRLMSVGDDGRLQVWDAAPLTPVRAELRESASLVRFLFGRSPLQVDILHGIQERPAVGEPSRRRALELAERFHSELAEPTQS